MLPVQATLIQLFPQFLSQISEPALITQPGVPFSAPVTPAGQEIPVKNQ